MKSEKHASQEVIEYFVLHLCRQRYLGRHLGKRQSDKGIP